MDLFLGIDIGTTGTKSMVVDLEGRIISSAYKGYRLQSARPGWVEQDAEDWWQAVVYTVRECTRDADIRAGIKALSLSTQGGSMVPVDEAGIPLRQAISWMDKRGEVQRNALCENKAEDYYYTITGSALTSGGNLIQIKWMSDNEPELFHKTHKFLSTVDYINFKLTGNYVIDVTNAAMTQLLNIKNKAWDAGILETLGIQEQKLPAIVRSGEVIGKLREAAALELGLSAHTTVVSGGHDQYCVALGSGAINSGDVVLSTGTAWVVLCVSDTLVLDAQNNFYAGSHVIDGKWGLLASLETGGVCLEWLKNNILSYTNDKNEVCTEEFETLDQMASKRKPGSDGLMFYPHFTGVECPNWAPKNKGTFTGLDLSHDKYYMARAIMEGVGYEIKWMLEVIESKGVHINCIKMLGGATRSSLWPGIIADITGVPVRISEVSDMACVGAAILAGKRTGLGDLSKKEKEILPDADNTLKYHQLFCQYKKGFELLKQLYME